MLKFPKTPERKRGWRMPGKRNVPHFSLHHSTELTAFHAAPNSEHMDDTMSAASEPTPPKPTE